MADFEQDKPRQGFARPGLLLIALLLLIAVWAALKLPDFAARAELGSAYAARMGCSCHFVEERAIDSCESDLESAAWMVSMEADEEARSVTASVPMLASRTARFRSGWGCLFEPDE